MTLHHMVYDCVTKKASKVEMTAEEEQAELARWAMEDAKQKAYVKPPTLEERIAKLEAQIGK